MSDQQDVACLPEQLSAQDARALIARESGQMSNVEPRRVCYPYRWYRARVSVPRLFGRRLVDVDCLVDARSGIASTSDHFQIDRRCVGAADILPVAIADESAQRAARRCLSHSLGRQLRTMADFRVRPVAKGVIYKSFWLVSCDGSEVMVDSTTGAWHLLQAA